MSLRTKAVEIPLTLSAVLVAAPEIAATQREAGNVAWRSFAVDRLSRPRKTAKTSLYSHGSRRHFQSKSLLFSRFRLCS